MSGLVIILGWISRTFGLEFYWLAFTGSNPVWPLPAPPASSQFVWAFHDGLLGMPGADYRVVSEVDGWQIQWLIELSGTTMGQVFYVAHKV